MGLKEEVLEMKKEVQEIQEQSFDMELLTDQKKQNKRQFITILVILGMWFATIGYLIYVLNDIGVETTTTTETVDIDDVQFGIDKIPTADVVEVRRGRWVKRQFADEPTAFGYRCSECHLTYEVDTNYCPNCGAKMDGKEVEGE